MFCHSKYEKSWVRHSDDLTIRYTMVDLKNVVQIYYQNGKK